MPSERFVLVHGFTQTARSWDVVVPALRAALAGVDPVLDVDVVAVDAPGHGANAEVHADLVAGARLIGEAGGRATYVGYSMGGRFCLHLALARPDLVERLVLVGATAGIEDPAERAARRADDELLAERIERIGVAAFLDEWLARPLFASLPPDAADVTDRRRNTAAGLAASLRLAGTGAQEPLWDRLAAIEVPVLALAGADDAKFTAIGRRVAQAVANGTFVGIAGAGHAAHLERPEATSAAIADWVRACRAADAAQ